MLEQYLVFTGRPNAGKSSVIKKIVGLDLATGKHPGTTRNISKHPLNRGLVLVDMPGYGRIIGVSRPLVNMRLNRIIRFLESKAEQIALAVHVLNISTFIEASWRLEKKGIIPVDVEMIHFLAEKTGEFPLVAANKTDKCDKNELDANLEELKHRISSGHVSAVEDKVFPVSAKTGEGLNALKNVIHDKLVVKGFKTPFKIVKPRV